MPRRTFAAVLLIAAIGLTGCTSTVAMSPAASNANDPHCADVIVRLPGSLAGEDRRWTDAQATGAWGDPTSVLFTCGLETPGPSTLRCITVAGVDWLVDETDDPKYRLTTFGRTPAAQVYVDSRVVSPNDVLDGLGTAVSQLPKTGECTSPEAPLDETDTGTK